jgi:signal transduction histidine kinase
VDGLLPGLREKHIRLDREPPPAEALIRGDQDRIQEVLTNVLHNAIQASGEGQRIVIGWRALEEPSNRPPRLVRFSIRDEGHGIPADEIERIFDRFHQVGVHGRRRKGGTGLGLAICREIAEHHGGRIWAESEPGRGSTFHVTLPLASASHPPDASSDSPRPPGGHPGEPTHA